MKNLILKALTFIKRILTIFFEKVMPDKEPIEFIKGYSSMYNRYREEEAESCYQEFKKYFKDAVFLSSYAEIINFSLKEVEKSDSKNEKLYLEFGVFKGYTANLISKKIDKLYAFDSFEGLRDIWGGGLKSKEHFDLKGIIPKMNNNVIPIKGYVQDTLKDFLKDKSEIIFVHMDLDTYDSTKFVLENIKPYLANGAVIIFGQIYNYPGWKHGEYKALKEVFVDRDYKFIAFSQFSKYGVIKFLSK